MIASGIAGMHCESPTHLKRDQARGGGGSGLTENEVPTVTPVLASRIALGAMIKKASTKLACMWQHFSAQVFEGRAGLQHGHSSPAAMLISAIPAFAIATAAAKGNVAMATAKMAANMRRHARMA